MVADKARTGLARVATLAGVGLPGQTKRRIDMQEDKRYPLYDWQAEVAAGDTVVGYDKWKQNRQALDKTEEDEMRREIVAKAAALYCTDTDDIEIDTDASLSYGDDGVWVQAWVWVYND
jgi:hypothetical protein